MSEQANSRAVISEEYRRLQQELHTNPNYGVASLQFAPVVAKAIRQLGVKSLSDYGAGKQNLKRGLDAEGVQIEYRPYDPAFPEYGAAQPAELVCCIDVLEHIEPDCLDAVLDELRHLTQRYGLFTVHTGPAVKVLADGRNAHLIQKPSSWWLPRLCERFEVESFQKVPNGFLVVVSPRKQS
jgi:hypothetical protein